MAGKKPPKFVFECQRCGGCCGRREVEVCLQDLKKWSEDGGIYSVYPHLNLKVGKEGIATGILLDGEGCPLFNEERKECEIYASRPLSCAAFPLGFDGERYFVVDGECGGIGKGKMSAESLAGMREAARRFHEARKETLAMVPVLQGLLIKHVAEESRKEIEKLPEEERKRLEELFRKAGESRE